MNSQDHVSCMKMKNFSHLSILVKRGHGHKMKLNCLLGKKLCQVLITNMIFRNGPNIRVDVNVDGWREVKPFIKLF